MAKKKKLDETTVTQGYPSFGGIVGDDDHPPGNIVFGHRYNRGMVQNRLTGAYPNFFVDDTDKWKWDIFTGLKSMQDKENYSDTLDSFNKKNSPISRADFNIWRHVKSRTKDHKWAPDKERLREPEQTDNELRKDKSSNMKDPDNPATGENDDKVIKKMNKHLQKEKDKI